MLTSLRGPCPTLRAPVVDSECIPQEPCVGASSPHCTEKALQAESSTRVPRADSEGRSPLAGPPDPPAGWTADGPARHRPPPPLHRRGAEAQGGQDFVPVGSRVLRQSRACDTDSPSGPCLMVGGQRCPRQPWPAVSTTPLSPPVPEPKRSGCKCSRVSESVGSPGEFFPGGCPENP